jgi:transposase-like protein
MTVMELGSEILKVDEVGRVRTPPEKREAMLAEYDRSGMTGAQFARFVGVRYSTLMYWLQRRRKEAGPAGQMATPMPDHPGWLEARVEGEISKSENLVVKIGGGFAWWWAIGPKPPRRANFSGRWDWSGDVEFFGKSAGVRGGGGLRHAKGIRRTFGVGRHGSQRAGQKRGALCV